MHEPQAIWTLTFLKIKSVDGFNQKVDFVVAKKAFSSNVD